MNRDQRHYISTPDGNMTINPNRMPDGVRCYFCTEPAVEDKHGIPQCRRGHAKISRAVPDRPR